MSWNDERVNTLKKLWAEGHSASQIAKQLGQDILQGRYAPGQRVGEQAVAEMFSLSRGPVRDALRILERLRIDLRHGHTQIAPGRLVIGGHLGSLACIGLCLQRAKRLWLWMGLSLGTAGGLLAGWLIAG